MWGNEGRRLGEDFNNGLFGGVADAMQQRGDGPFKNIQGTCRVELVGSMSFFPFGVTSCFVQFMQPTSQKAVITHVCVSARSINTRCRSWNIFKYNYLPIRKQGKECIDFVSLEEDGNYGLHHATTTWKVQTASPPSIVITKS